MKIEIKRNKKKLCSIPKCLKASEIEIRIHKIHYFLCTKHWKEYVKQMLEKIDKIADE